MTLITISMIYEELQAQRRLLEEMREEKVSESIEEISLGKAAKLLRLGSETVLKYVLNGKLKARIYRDKDRMKRYRFRITDIREFQKRESTILISERPQVRTAEEIGEEIFGGNNARN